MRTIILAGGPALREPGCPTALPRPLWPLLMRPLLARLVEHLVRGGTRALSICTSGTMGLQASRLSRERFGLDELCFTHDEMPRGPAGCLKDNERFVGGETFVVTGGACAFDEPVDSLVRRHRRQQNVLTIFCLAGSRRPSGVYVCEPAVLEHVPDAGYCDLKEQLIPRLIERGLRVGVLALHGPAVEVLGSASYLGLHAQVLRAKLAGEAAGCPGRYVLRAPDVWVATDARISRTTRLFGPLIVGPRAKITNGAVVIGPASVGPDACIRDDAVVSECAVWGRVVVPPGLCIHRRVLVPDDLGAARPSTGRVAHAVAVPRMESRNHVTICR